MLQKVKFQLMKRSRTKKLSDFLCLTNPSVDSSILDIGATNVERSPYANYLEKHYFNKSKITVLSLHQLTDFSKKYPEIVTVTYDGGKYPFKDDQFSIAHANAVIEHVGGFTQQVFFLREMARVSQQFYFTTPAKGFPIETHTNLPFIHWLSKRKFNWIVKKSGKDWAAGNYLNLLSKKNLYELLESADIKEFRVIIHKLGPFPLHYTVWGKKSGNIFE